MEILMEPDYADGLFWPLEDRGHLLGDLENIYYAEDKVFKLKPVKGLKEWFYEWDEESLYHTHHWANLQWKDWWQRGQQLAKEIKEQLPEDWKLYYFSVTEKFWKFRPEDSNDGGLFDYGEPIEIK